MKKKIAAGVLLLSCLSMATTAIASVEMIDNISFDLPGEFELNSDEKDGDATVKTYINKDDEMVIMFMSSPFETDVPEFADLMVDATLTGIKKDSKYTEVQKTQDFPIDGINATAHLTAYTLDNYNTIQSLASFYSGSSVINIITAFPLSSGSEPLNTFFDIIKSINYSDSSYKPEEKQITKYTKGKYKVGTDIPAGEYAVFSDNGTRAYFAVSSDSNSDDIIFNDNFEYNSIITVYDGEYLELSRCYAVPYDESVEIDSSKTGSMFKVGKDIPAGEYKLDSGNDRGYYCIYPDSRHNNIISNDLFEGQNYVTVSDGQYLILSRCDIIQMPEEQTSTESNKKSDTEIAKEVQTKLNESGYDCGTPDGIVGSGTASAIKKYQEDNNLEATGTITDELIASLGIN